MGSHRSALGLAWTHWQMAADDEKDAGRKSHRRIQSTGSSLAGAGIPEADGSKTPRTPKGSTAAGAGPEAPKTQRAGSIASPKTPRTSTVTGKGKEDKDKAGSPATPPPAAAADPDKPLSKEEVCSHSNRSGTDGGT